MSRPWSKCPGWPSNAIHQWISHNSRDRGVADENLRTGRAEDIRDGCPITVVMSKSIGHLISTFPMSFHP